MAEWVLLTASNVAYKVFCLIHLWFCFRSSFSKMSTECQGDMRGLKKNTFIRSMNTFWKVTGAASHHTHNHSVVLTFYNLQTTHTFHEFNFTKVSLWVQLHMEICHVQFMQQV